MGVVFVGFVFCGSIQFDRLLLEHCAEVFSTALQPLVQQATRTARTARTLWMDQIKSVLVEDKPPG